MSSGLARVATLCSLAVVLVAACGGGGGLTGVAPPQVVLDSHLDVGDGNDCRSAGPLVTIGLFKDAGTFAPDVAKSGDTLPGGVLTASCTIHPDGTVPDTKGNDVRQFTVEASMKLGADVVFTLSGKTLASDISGTNAGTPGLSAFVGRGGGSAGFAQTDGGCVLRYLSDREGAVDGRIWGELTCPKAVEVAAPGAAPGPQTCAAVAHFRFENCGF